MQDYKVIEDYWKSEDFKIWKELAKKSLEKHWNKYIIFSVKDEKE